LSSFHFSSINAQSGDEDSLTPLADDHQFSENETQLMDAVLEFYDVADLSYASLSDVPNESTESFNIPAGLVGMPATVSYTKSFSTDGGYDGLKVWTGTNGKDFISIGDILKDGYSFKTIYWSYLETEYLFFTLDGVNGIVLREGDKPEGECGTFEEDDLDEPSASISTDLCYDSDCEATVTVLVVHDIIPCNGSTFWCNIAYSVLAWIRLNSLTINQQVLNNSQVDNLTLEYIFRYIDVQDSESSGVDLVNLSLNAEVEDARLSVGADLVQLLVPNPGNNWGTIVGRAFLGYARPRTGPANHSVVLTDFIGAIRYSSIHEIVHNFGGHHNEPGNCGPFPGGFVQCGDNNVLDEPCGNGHRLTTSATSSVASIMALSPNNNRIPNLSNPSVNWIGIPTGTADDDNALLMRTVTCRAGLIYDSRPSPNWQMFHNCLAEWNQEIPITLNWSPPSDDGPGSGPFTYKWLWEAGQVGQNSKLSFVPDETGSSLIVPQYAQISPGITIYVQVTNELGETTEIHRYLPIGDCSDPQELVYDPNSIQDVIFYDMLGRVIVQLSQATHPEILEKSLELQSRLVSNKCIMITEKGFVPYSFFRN
jgi:hypothetical protein